MIVAGKDGQPEELMEGIVLSFQGSEVGRLLKGINPKGSAGDFHTDFQLEMPKTSPPGRYSLTTTLFLGKRPVDTHTLTFEVRRGGRDKP